MHRTLVGNFHQPLALLGVEIAFDGDDALDVVEHADLGFSILAVLRVNLAMGQRDGDALQRQRLAIGVHPHCHRGAGLGQYGCLCHPTALFHWLRLATVKYVIGGT